MTRSITTSIRLTPELRAQLEQAAHSLHRGKNWIISEALKSYFVQLSSVSLAEEARRQSLLASQYIDPAEDLWEQSSDTNDWN